MASILRVKDKNGNIIDIPAIQGDRGEAGTNGVGIKSVVQTTTSSADGGSNIITVTKTDNTTSTFTVKNGSKGSKGDKGDTGAAGKDGSDYVLTEADKAEIVQLVIESLGGNPVFGYVDKNNNIIVSGNLADGSYNVKYEMEDGSTVDIGDLVLDNNVYYSITNTLTNCTNSNNITEAVEGSSYSATITANSGYELKTVTVTMGGSPVSVSGGNINIASVTGDIVITAVAEVAGPAYTNLLPNAVDASGNAFVGTNGEKGYKTGYRLNSSGVEKQQSGTTCSGYIPYTNAADIIYIKGITLSSTDSYNAIAFYDSSKTFIKNLVISEVNDAFTLNGDIWTVEPSSQTTIDNPAFFRVSCGSITDETIVTINEEITGTDIESTYTNVLPLAVDASGNDYKGTNGEDGYKTGYKISVTSGNESSADACVSGFIKLPEGKQSTIRIKNITLSSAASINNLVFYKSDKTKQNGYAGPAGIFNSDVTVTDGVYLIKTSNWFTNDTTPAFFRFSCGEITDETIVTINEEIV